MSTDDTVTQRVNEVVNDFDRFVAAYDSLSPFNSNQLSLHRATITLRNEAGSASAAVADPQYVVRLRQTLVAWGLGTRGSRLAKDTEFSDALRAALPDIIGLESLQIYSSGLPDDVPERLWELIASLGVAHNDAKIVAGTKTLHHLLPNLVPPMDRAWTGRFFRLYDPQWQSSNQRYTFLRLYRQFVSIARTVSPQRYVTGAGWRTSPTKILDNAIIGYCKTVLVNGQRSSRSPSFISFTVPGYPPAKSEARSMLANGHAHASRVNALLTAAREALRAHPAFRPIVDGPIALDLVLHPHPEDDPWDATNYLGGVADVLEDKARRGMAIDHLGELAHVWLYRNDRQIRHVTYREEPSTTASYTVTVRALVDSLSSGR